MRVLICPESFTGTLTAVQAAEAMAAGWSRGAPHDDLTLAPLSAGGSGFLHVLEAALPALTALVAGLKLRRERMRDAATDDRLLATELADALARRGVPFRQAHEIAGRRFAAAEASGQGLLEMPPSDGVTGADLASVDLERALTRRGALGGASPKRVAQAARRAAKRIAAERKAAAERSVR